MITEVKKAQKDQGNCEACDKPINRGDSYKWVKANRFSLRHVRCIDCPTWHIWEYSDSVNAQIARIEHHARQDFGNANESWESGGEFETFLGDVADQIEELAGERREVADNIESGFGHATEKSEEAGEQADNLESWAEEFRGADIPEYPEDDDKNEDEMDEWRGACETLLDELLGNNPI